MNAVTATPIVENAVRAEVESAEIFSTLLSHFIPGARAEDVTDNMRKRFGSIHKAMRRRPEELRRVPGLCETAASVIHLLHQLYSEILHEDLQREEPTFRHGQAVRYCRELFGAEERNVCKIFYLRGGRVVYEGPSSIGTIGAHAILMREVVATALTHQASEVLVVFGRSYGGSSLHCDELAMMRRILCAMEPFRIDVSSELVLSHT